MCCPNVHPPPLTLSRAPRPPQVTALKALSEFVLAHSTAVGLLLKRDTELWGRAHGSTASYPTSASKHDAAAPPPQPTGVKGDAGATP
eukprot:317172-Chlamydomonas_euryale.AAC.1